MRPLETWLLNYAVNALWQVPIVFAAAWIAARASRRAGPAFQHALWTSALIAEVLLPACSARPDQAFQTLLHWLASFRQSNVAQDPHVTVTMGPAHAAAGFHMPPTLLAATALLYLGALLYFATRLCLGLHQTASLRRRAEPLALTGYAGQSYHRYAQLFSVNDAVVAASTEIASPITLGVRRPILLLPSELDTNLLGEDLDAALAHEFAHMHRRDFAKNLAYEILSLPIAFHPLLWLTRSRMAETRELICDAMAADVVAGRQRYARSLLRLATKFSEQTHAPTPHAIGIFDAHPFKNFERRVMNLTHNSMELRGAARLAITALSLVLIGGACTSALAFRMQVAEPATQTPTPPTRTATANPTPNPTPAPVSPVVIGVPRSAQPPQSFQVDIADASSPNPVIKVLTPPFVEPTQTESGQVPHIVAGVMAGNRTTFVAPVYPEDAKKAKLSGTVVLRAIIGKNGKMQSLQVLSSTNPTFNNSALEAVQHWTYRPYLLNGNPTAVDTTITVNYALNK
jgi:TonB family protein